MTVSPTPWHPSRRYEKPLPFLFAPPFEYESQGS